jgi:HEAT repeat protein
MAQSSVLVDFLAAVAASDDERAEWLAAQLAPEDEPALLSLSAAGDVERRWWALRALAIHGTPAAVKQIATALADGDAGVRAAAALALAQLHARHTEATSAYVGSLAQLLADDDGLVRQVAADALAQCGDAAVAVLAGVLRGSEESVRTRAANALRKVGSYRAAAHLYPLLNDPNPLVRTYAYEGLDELGLLENILLLP